MAKPGPELDLARSSIWHGDVGDGFLPSAQNFAVEAGVAPGIDIFGSPQAHDLVLLSLSYGHMLGQVLGEQCRFCDRRNLVLRKMKILVCNSRSSSLKFSLFEADDELLVAEEGIDWTTTPARLVLQRPGPPDVRRPTHPLRFDLRAEEVRRGVPRNCEDDKQS